MANPNPRTDRLIPWQRGQSGNPSGGSKTLRLRRQVLAMLDAGDDLEERFIRIGMALALEGDFRFWSYLFDRVDGRIPRGGDDGVDIEAIIDLARRKVDRRKERGRS
jgi:hypothetical protein